MQESVRKSKLVIAVLSEAFFLSKWCAAEVQAAMEVGIKVIPVFSGDDFSNNNIDGWIQTFKHHPSFGYVFKQQAVDVKNKFNAKQTKAALDTLLKVHLEGFAASDRATTGLEV